MSIIYTLLAGFLCLYFLWIFYLAVMTLKRARDENLLTKTATVFGIPVLVIGLILDFIANVFVMSLMLLELPKETTVTARLKRHNKESTGWRLSIVKWAEPLLDPFDPSGDHV